ncbi:MAG: PIN domain nuclease [Candidatus Aminicenantes bacterium]|nr:MAG: PIN domain nuclease [Candidatus Aminicenantes bacterium]
MILVDSSVWADFFNGYPSPEEIKLKTLLDTRADIAITGIIASEVLSGFKDEKTFEEVKDTFLQLPQTQINLNSHILAAKMYRNLRSKGITIRSIIDCLIAIIAIEDNLLLLHKDRDFEMIGKHYPSLKLLQV